MLFSINKLEEEDQKKWTSYWSQQPCCDAFDSVGIDIYCIWVSIYIYIYIVLYIIIIVFLAVFVWLMDDDDDDVCLLLFLIIVDWWCLCDEYNKYNNIIINNKYQKHHHINSRQKIAFHTNSNHSQKPNQSHVLFTETNTLSANKHRKTTFSETKTGLTSYIHDLWTYFQSFAG